MEHPMGLIRFHRVLIGSGIVFCAGFAAWQLRAGMRTGRSSDILTGLGFAFAAGLLIFYLLHLRRFLRLPGEGTAEGRRPFER
jgi:hypothetical protein